MLWCLENLPPAKYVLNQLSKVGPVTAFKLVKDEATGSEMQKRSTKRRRCRSCKISRRSRRCRRSAEVRCRRCRRKVYEKGACMWCMRRCAGVQRKEVRMSTLGIQGSPIIRVCWYSSEKLCWNGMFSSMQFMLSCHKLILIFCQIITSTILYMVYQISVLKNTSDSTFGFIGLSNLTMSASAV